MWGRRFRLPTIMFYRRKLPHWHPDIDEGTFLFVTWRLFGSVPRVRQLRRLAGESACPTSFCIFLRVSVRAGTKCGAGAFACQPLCSTAENSPTGTPISTRALSCLLPGVCLGPSRGFDNSGGWQVKAPAPPASVFFCEFPFVQALNVGQALSPANHYVLPQKTPPLAPRYRRGHFPVCYLAFVWVRP